MHTASIKTMIRGIVTTILTICHSYAMEQQATTVTIGDTVVDINETSLCLNNRKLTILPPEFGNLTNLQSCMLTFNELTTLPLEIGNLTRLESLLLYNNQLDAIPLELGNLANLKCLYLTDNRLTTIPLEIEKLTNLTQLSLAQNRLTTFPPEFGNLTNLKFLDLKNNPLSGCGAKWAEQLVGDGLNNCRKFYKIIGNVLDMGGLIILANKQDQNSSFAWVPKELIYHIGNFYYNLRMK